MHLYDDEYGNDLFCSGVTEPVRQIGVYELDLCKLAYFGWINSLSLGYSILRAQLKEEGSANVGSE